MPKEFLKISTEKSGFRLYPLRHALPRSLFRKRVIHGWETDRTSHFPIRHWKNVSIELEYITAAGGRGSGQDTPGTWWFLRIIFLVYIAARGAGTPDFTTGEGERHSSHLFGHEPRTAFVRENISSYRQVAIAASGKILARSARWALYERSRFTGVEKLRPARAGRKSSFSHLRQERVPLSRARYENSLY